MRSINYYCRVVSVVSTFLSSYNYIIIYTILIISVVFINFFENIYFLSAQCMYHENTAIALVSI